jgi:hypothetical protein
MADLHKFQDDVRSDEGRAKPISARRIDENFQIVRLKIADNLTGFLEITQNSPQADELRLSLSIPTSGKRILGFNNGTLTLFEVEEC